MTEAPARIWAYTQGKRRCGIWRSDDDMAVAVEYTRSDIADTLRAEVARLRSALRTMVYEATHLSPEEEDLSHWCKFTGDALQAARAALAHGEADK
tara:strand:+ start:251 stop:538 length:288 start_codon:yes stop_codon:yes gene_type:complete